MERKRIMRAIFLLLLAIVLFSALLLKFCTSNDWNRTMTEIDPETSFLDYVETKYNYEELNHALQKEPNASKFCNAFDIRYYKTYQDHFYTVIDTNQGLCLVFFSANKKYEGYMNLTLSPKVVCEGFQNLTIGTPLDKIIELDPKGYYPFLYSGRSDYPKISYHFLKNGFSYIFTMYYLIYIG